MNARSVVLAAALCAVTGPPAAARQITSPVLIDPTLTAGAGATITTAVGAMVARGEDAVVPHRLFVERGVPRRTANIAYRLFKFAFFDAPQERLLLVVNHELFGHGARLRERTDGPIGYRFGVPFPYGQGGGATTFILDRNASVHDLMAFHVGGMEADAVAAAIVGHGAFSNGRMRTRDGYRYLGFELDTFSYILSTDDDGEEAGHDVGAFLETYNLMASATGASALSARTLRREALISLANPMVAYAVYGVGRYVWNGATDVAVPALSIAGVRYLPMLRYRLAPFGTEWALVNELGGRIRPTQIELRVGRAPQATPWGMRVRQRELTTWRGWSLDASVDVWRQPRLLKTAHEPLTLNLRPGVHVRGRVERPLIPVWFSTAAATAIIDVGVKSTGFVPGEPLRGGIVVRGGVGLPLSP